MDKENAWQNRARLRASVDDGYSANLNALQIRSFSVAENVRTEQHVAEPDYSRERNTTSAGAIVDQPDPNTTAPDGKEIWDLSGYQGGHGYLELDAAETADIELWAFDRQNTKWFLVDSVQNVPSFREFRFAGQVRGRLVWLRLTNVGAAIRNIALRFSAE